MNLFLFFSHKLTEKQEYEVLNNLNVDKIIYLPDELQRLWSNVPENLESLIQYSKPFKRFLYNNASKGDLVLIQGDFGLVYIMVNFAFFYRLIPIYSSTKRISIEQVKQDKVFIKKIFKHSFFRMYEREEFYD